MIFDLLVGHPPFTGNNNKKVMDNIIKKKLALPSFLTASGRDLLSKLLKKHPGVRMGADSIRTHIFWRVDKSWVSRFLNRIFLRPLNWDKVYSKEYPPPITPSLSGLEDTQNFNEKFTKMSLHSLDDPVSHADGGGEPTCLKEDVNNPFDGFSYVAQDTFMKDGEM